MFKIKHNEETVNKTLRFQKSLLDKMSQIAQNENISLNSFIIQCCEYAMENMEQKEE